MVVYNYGGSGAQMWRESVRELARPIVLWYVLLFHLPIVSELSWRLWLGRADRKSTRLNSSHT